MKHTTIIVAVGFALAAALSALPAQAQNLRSFVSGQGSDSNNCTLAAPCRTFAFAITRTNAGGEILTLDPAGYGPVTINKSISIVSSLGVGGINTVVPGGVGITIAAAADAVVSLRGLNIDGLGIAATGIVFNSGKSLTIENCVIRHMSSDGIDFQSTTATSALTVSNSLVADNGDSGILLDPTGSATAVFNRVEVNNNVNNGIFVSGQSSAGTNTIDATVSESIAAGNGDGGFYSAADSGRAPTSIMVSHSVAANNFFGVHASGGSATIRLANSTLTGNSHGWSAVINGVVDSFGDNYIDGNGGNTGPLTPVARQ